MLCWAQYFPPEFNIVDLFLVSISLSQYIGSKWPPTIYAIGGLPKCRVVEGNLLIVLMENLDFVTDLNNRSFPALREITGYLFFFHVFGLRSIGQMFPNLAVIRGQELFFHYSFLVFELMQLRYVFFLHLNV